MNPTDLLCFWSWYNIEANTARSTRVSGQSSELGPLANSPANENVSPHRTQRGGVTFGCKWGGGGPKGEQHSLAGEGWRTQGEATLACGWWGAGEPNSDDWTESLALSVEVEGESMKCHCYLTPHSKPHASTLSQSRLCFKGAITRKVRNLMWKIYIYSGKVPYCTVERLLTSFKV